MGISPFYIFGLLVQLTLVILVLYYISKARKFLKKRARWGGDQDALAYTKAVLDPNGPTRIDLGALEIYKKTFNKSQKDGFLESQHDES